MRSHVYSSSPGVPVDSGALTEFSARSELRPLDSKRILRTFDEHRIDYVLIGGIACLMHGATRVTVDTDVVAARDRANLGRLFEALKALDAAVLVSDGRQAMEDGEAWEVVSLRRGPGALAEAEAWHFTTDAGPLDVIFAAAGVGCYEDHLPRAELFEVFGVQVQVAGLEDLILSKESLLREKDTSVLAELRALRGEAG